MFIGIMLLQLEHNIARRIKSLHLVALSSIKVFFFGARVLIVHSNTVQGFERLPKFYRYGMKLCAWSQSHYHLLVQTWH